jgi:hypothetical protein
VAQGPRAVASALRAVGLGAAPGLPAYHRMLSHRRRSGLAVSRPLPAGLLRAFVPPGAPVVIGLDEALVHKSDDGRGPAAVAALQAVRCDIGMPSRVIRLSTEQATRASVFWPGRVRARGLRPMMAL